MARNLTWYPLCTCNEVIFSPLHRCMLPYLLATSYYYQYCFKKVPPGAKSRGKQESGAQRREQERGKERLSWGRRWRWMGSHAQPTAMRIKVGMSPFTPTIPLSSYSLINSRVSLPRAENPLQPRAVEAFTLTRGISICRHFSLSVLEEGDD